MRKRSMPYRIYGGLSFYQRKEIKDTIAYFRLTVNPNDEEAFKRIINYPARGIGDTTVSKITAAATDHNVSLWTVLCEPLTYGVNINKGTVTKLQSFRDLMTGFIESVSEKNAYELGTEIIRQSGIIGDVCQDNSPENLSRKENIEELANGMSDFCAQRQEEGNNNITLGDFLSEVSLLTDQDSDKDGDDEKITLMTVHSAKGLEFRNVFVVGMEENLFPSGMVGDSPRALEEERRLFYVAITRAEDHCFLTYAKSRYRYGKMEFGSPSRFLKDIDVRFLKLPQDAGLGRRVDESAASFRSRTRQEVIAPTVPRNLKRVTPSMGTASSSPAGTVGNIVQQGQLIEHERFGLGEVMKVEGEGDNAKATIRFKNAGPDHVQLHKALETDGRKQFLDLFPFCSLAALIKLLDLRVNQSDRFINQSRDFLDLLLKLGVRLHADLLDTLPFVLESFFQLVQICSIRFHVLERILCVGDRLIVLYLLSNRSL